MDQMKHQIKQSIEYIKTNGGGWGVDATRFTLFGESAGGHLSTLTSHWMRSELGDESIKGVVDIYGPTSIVDYQVCSTVCPQLFALNCLPSTNSGLPGLLLFGL